MVPPSQLERLGFFVAWWGWCFWPRIPRLHNGWFQEPLAPQKKNASLAVRAAGSTATGEWHDTIDLGHGQKCNHVRLLVSSITSQPPNLLHTLLLRSFCLLATKFPFVDDKTTIFPEESPTNNGFRPSISQLHAEHVGAFP